MNVLIIVGSSRRRSHSLGLGKAIEAQLKANGADTELIDLIELGLPIMDADVDKAKTYDGVTKQFIELSKSADAYVWVTPVYHNLFSGILKNALDWQHFFLDGKVVGMASNGNNRSGVAVDSLMLAARSQHLITIPTRVCTDGEDYDENMNITSAAIQTRIAAFAEQLVTVTKKLAHEDH